MGIVTAKQLKQKTGEIIKRIRAGEKFTLTYRGKPVARIEPAKDEAEEEAFGKLRSFELAWKDIEKSLGKTEPEFVDWHEATRWIRGRN